MATNIGRAPRLFFLSADQRPDHAERRARELVADMARMLRTVWKVLVRPVRIRAHAVEWQCEITSARAPSMNGTIMLRNSIHN